MLGSISSLILVICLLGNVADSALVRIKRQWDFDTDPYGACGKPHLRIPHGGIKLLPIADFDDPYDDSCQTRSTTFCELAIYCIDGYEVDGDLECVHDEETNEYKWEGNPKCVKPLDTDAIYIGIGVVVFSVIVIVIAVIIRRRRRATLVRCVTTRTVVITPRSISSNGPPGYTRFDDSHAQVPQDTTTPNTQNN